MHRMTALFNVGFRDRERFCSYYEVRDTGTLLPMPAHNATNRTPTPILRGNVFLVRPLPSATTTQRVNFYTQQL
jgi:hypothetical protein